MQAISMPRPDAGYSGNCGSPTNSTSHFVGKNCFALNIMLSNDDVGTLRFNTSVPTQKAV